MQRTATTRARLGHGLLALVLLTAACGSDDTDDPIESGDDTAAGATIGSSTSAVESTQDQTDDPEPTTQSSSTTTGSTGSTGTEPATSTSPSTSGSTTTIDGLVDVRPVPITSVATLGQTTLEITVEGGVEPCFIIQRVDLSEAADAVELMVHAGSEPGAVCIQIIELHTTIVELADPLGDRVIIDGTTGDSLTPSS